MDEKRVCLITGGTSGIGLACAKAFAQAGWRVYTLARREGRVPACAHIQADVTDESQCDGAVRKIVDEAGRLDLLVHCAGSGISGAAEFTPMEQAASQMAVNTLGAANMAKACLPAMRESRHGRIIFISSVAGVTPIPFQAWYSASKAALNSYAMALGNEVRPFGVSVCVVMPGDTSTGFTDARRKLTSGDDVYAGVIERSVAKMEKDERTGHPPEKVAALVLKVAGKKRVAPQYTVGVGYKTLVALARILPPGICRYVLGKLYA